MPLIMDDGDQYMDDLFGDGDGDPLPIPAPAPVVKGLPQRLDELASSNCTQKISWSRFGVVAAVDETGRTVNLYTYGRDVKSRGWKLSEPTLLWSEANNSERRIVHVEWSNMGNALVVVDSFGRTIVYVQGYALNQMLPARSNQTAHDDELHGLVGLYWFPVFPQQQKSGMYWSARWDGEDFEYAASHHTASGAYNPFEGKSALLCLDRCSLLRLLYEQRDGRWSEASAEVNHPTACSVTHATFGPNTDESVLLVTYDVSKSLRVFRIKIDWNTPADLKENPTAQVKPVLEVSALLFQNSCLPTSQLSSNATPHTTIESSQRVQLSQLEITPAAPESRTHDPTYPTVMAIFTLLPPAGSIQLLDVSQQYQHASSLVCRWQIRAGATDTLSPCFDQLTQKKKATSAAKPRPASRLDRAPDTLLHCPVMSTTHLRNSTLLSFAMSDGSIHFRDRESMEMLSLDTGLLNAQTKATLPEIKNMAQIGFSFPLLESSLHVALSPNYCMVAVFGKGGQLGLKKMEYNMVPLRELTADDPRFHSVIVAMALQHGTAILSYKSSDDLLAILPEDGNEELKLGFVQQCRRTTRTNYDLITQEGAKNIISLHKLQPLYKCLSVQNTLGMTSNGGRNLRAKLAWMTLNLRFSCLVLANTLKPNEELRPEMAVSLIGQLRWGLDFFVYLTQELFDLSHKIKGHEGDHAFLTATLQRENSPALFILLSSFTRMMLTMLSRPIRQGWTHAQTGAKSAVSGEQRVAFVKMVQLYRNAPLNIVAFQTYLSELETLVKRAYGAAGLPDAAMTRIENGLFQRAELPVELMPAIRTALTDGLAKLMRASEPGTVHNYEISWLGFTDDPRSRSLQDRVIIDVIRKVVLSKEAKLRRCLRCLSVMEDIQSQGPGWQSHPPWVVNSQKNCVCFSGWAVEDGRD